MNLNKLMKQAQKMQEQMAKTQAELEDKTVEVQAAGGKVTVVANGAGDVVSIKIAKEIVDPEDVEFLEEAVLSGVQAGDRAGQGARAIGDDEDHRRDGTCRDWACKLAIADTLAACHPVAGSAPASRPLIKSDRRSETAATVGATALALVLARKRKLRECLTAPSSRPGDRNFRQAARANAHRMQS